MIDPEAFRSMCDQNHYVAGQIISDTRWAALAQFLFTVGILEGDDRGMDTGYRRRWCYHNFEDAIVALVEWKERGFSGKPLNYITEK